MLNPSSSPRTLESLARRSTQIFARTASNAWLVGDVETIRVARAAMDVTASAAGMDASDVFQQLIHRDRQRLEVLQNRFAVVAIDYWNRDALNGGRRVALEAASIIDLISEKDARVKGQPIGQVTIEAARNPKTYMPGIMASMRHAVRKTYGADVASGFISALDSENRTWALIGLFRSRSEVLRRDEAVARLIRVAIESSKGNEVYSPILDAIPVGRTHSMQYFRALRQSSPQVFNLVIACATIRALGQPLPQSVVTAVRHRYDNAPIPIARLLGELLSASPTFASVRSQFEHDLRQSDQQRKAIERLATLPLAPADPLHALAVKAALAGDALDRVAADAAKRALTQLGPVPEIWNQIPEVVESDSAFQPWFRVRAEEGTPGPTPQPMSIAKRLESYVDLIDPLEEYLTLSVLSPQATRSLREQKYVGHLAFLTSPIPKNLWPSIAPLLNASGVQWGRIQDSKTEVLAFPSDDPIQVTRALVQLLEACPEPRPGVVMCAGSFTFSIGTDGPTVSGPMIERLKTLIRIVRLGQFLVALPADPAYSMAKNAEYSAALKQLEDARGRVEGWGLTRLPDGRQYDIWCVLSERLSVRWPMTDLRGR